MPPQQIIWFIIGTVIILFGAYYVTYFVGMKASGRTRATTHNRNIVVHDRFSIARDKGFYVVEIAGKVYIVAAAASSMTLLDTIDAEEFKERAESSAGGVPMPWADTPVGRYGNKLTKKVVSFVAAKSGKQPKEDEENIYAATTDFADSMKRAEQDAGDSGEGKDNRETEES